VQEEICGPEVEHTKSTCGCFSAPIVESIMELRGAQCQNMRRSFENV
jgi:hypothetical protein